MTFCTDHGTLGEFLKYRWPGCDEDRVLGWPPDTFALAAAVLKDTGSYVHVLDLSELFKRAFGTSDKWRAACRIAGRDWRKNINDLGNHDFEVAIPQDVVPDFVRDAWLRILDGSATPLEHDSLSGDLVLDLLTVMVAADIASAGTGLYYMDGHSDTFMNLAATINDLRNRRRNFCMEIDTRKLCVMPKLHTPQRGLTIRSLSHHLSLIESSELHPNWWASLPSKENFDILNLLLLPWPTDVSPSQFDIERRQTPPSSHVNNARRYFSYHPAPTSNDELAARMRAALKKAKTHTKRIHAIVLPELALDEEQYSVAEQIAFEERAILVAGVHVENDGRSQNTAVAQPIAFSEFGPSSDDEEIDEVAADFLRIVQSKHHRWCLDRNQIIQYGLGGRLPASKECWESTAIDERNLHFFTLANWMTMSVLVCEDLARQDPVSEALRAVAPSLVVALLMDGPQLMSRWSSRYATVLAEDPGCSVLTITSLGMSKRSRPPGISAAEDKSRVIALWRDAIHGAEEIRLDDDADACVLSLVCKGQEEVTADGRGDGGFAFYPVFAGVHQIASGFETAE